MQHAVPPSPGDVIVISDLHLAAAAFDIVPGTTISSYYYRWCEGGCTHCSTLTAVHPLYRRGRAAFTGVACRGVPPSVRAAHGLHAASTPRERAPG